MRTSLIVASLCHEGNHGLVNMLEIARAADKKPAGSIATSSEPATR